MRRCQKRGAFSADGKQAQRYIESACASLLEGDYDRAEVSYHVAICLSPATDVRLAVIGKALRTMLPGASR